MKPNWKLLATGWLLVLAGSGLALAVQTAGGVDVQDVRFDTEGGQRLSALLYVPESATAETPAPAVLAVHGYINSRLQVLGRSAEAAGVE
jgi:cephalosporin-C deacetylase-like acetyl esterase